MEQLDNAEPVTLDGTDENQPQRTIPHAPNPSADPGVIPLIGAGENAEENASTDVAVSELRPLTALKILSEGVQALADLTGDIPATPPPNFPLTPNASSEDLRDTLKPRSRAPSRPVTPPSNVPSDDIRRAKLNTRHIGETEAHVLEHDAVGAGSTPPRVQYEALARKFFSKKPPPVSINDYLLRLARFCPMSTAVYLAAGSYIHKVAVEDKLVPVTVRTVHRLLVASLRVAMKALEDLSYPHKRFAGVGGVSERELAKLEISLCYLIDFNLKVNEKQLKEKMVALQHLKVAKNRMSESSFRLKMPVRNRSVSQTIL